MNCRKNQALGEVKTKGKAVLTGMDPFFQEQRITLTNALMTNEGERGQEVRVELNSV